MGNWERFDECFDSSDGGALYVREDSAGEGVYVAGATWLDGGEDDLHYFACVAHFDWGEDLGDFVVEELYDGAEAFNQICDGDVAREIGWAATMAEATDMVDEFVETDNFDYEY